MEVIIVTITASSARSSFMLLKAGSFNLETSRNVAPAIIGSNELQWSL